MNGRTVVDDVGPDVDTLFGAFAHELQSRRSVWRRLETIRHL
jgi:hypothetical protein